MSDKFLYRLRETPRPEFAEALKARIFREPRRSPTVRRLRTGLVVLLAALVIAACAAPQTRTPIRRAIETIKVFVLGWDLPITNSDESIIDSLILSGIAFFWGI